MELAEKEEVKAKGRKKFFVVELVKKRWPSLVALAVAASGLPASTDPMSLILFLAALFYPISGAIRGHLRGVRTILIQATALVLFGVISLVSIYVNREAGLILLAAGYIGHTIWDIAHFRSGKIVWRGYAEFCAVFDLFVAAFLLAPIFM
ncbi:hypothetical protein [Paenibacillus mendelii]|uniref:Metal-dependent hydrolase n=1 Tax=Paenibacillus mendelii TaxID=206163 RepID=A0ABV6J312_9BACL|nr:hypothetical protein [Paenibacillus mendelii]MCQ6559368.1 hypothetical protein [Paenibacillus mendelii]